MITLELKIIFTSLMQDIYQELWKPKEYLEQYYKTPHVASDEKENFLFLMNWLEASGNNLERCLDFGCGCTLHHMMPLSPYVTEIHLADYMSSNLEEIQAWLDNAETAHDWDVYFQGVLELEAQSQTSEISLNARKQALREKITQLKTADIRSNKPLGTELSYDLVTSYYCAEAVASSKEEWEMMFANLSTLVAPGGTLISSVMRHCNFYMVGNKKFPSAYVDENDISQVLVQNNFDLDKSEIKVAEVKDWAEEGFDGICMVRAEKKS